MLDARAAILKSMTVLYVEDDSETADALNFSFCGAIEKLIMAASAEEGLEKFADCKPDIIITDITLPYMSGLEFTRKIKEISQDTPVIVISGNRSESLYLESIDAGVDSYFIKPVDLRKLKNTLYRFAESCARMKTAENGRKLINKVLDNSRELYLAGDDAGLTYMNATLLELLGFSDVYSANKMIYENGITIIENNSKERRTTFGSWISFVKNMDGYESMISFLCEGTLKSDAKSYIARVSRVKEENSYIISFVDVTVIERQKQFFHNLAIKDPLTEIYNRHKFNEEIRRETARSRRYGMEYSLIMFDIDRFKNVNDTYGHQVGDTVLKELAQVVSQNIRDTDIFARYGGEEFIVIAPEIKIDGACVLAEKLRKCVENHNFEHIGSLTCSFGVAAHKKEMSSHDIIKEADEALYKAKAQGRNRVEIK